MDIKKLETLPKEIINLVHESEQEGYRFIRRLVDEYESKDNDFSAYGEALFSITVNQRLIGIGGVNVQPGGDPAIGRLRHVYISKSSRGIGVGKTLVSVIEEHSKQYFKKLVLFTNFEKSIGFYNKIGYKPVNFPKISHEKMLT